MKKLKTQQNDGVDFGEEPEEREGVGRGCKLMAVLLFLPLVRWKYSSKEKGKERKVKSGKRKTMEDEEKIVLEESFGDFVTKDSMRLDLSRISRRFERMKTAALK